jgi:hypothetical protein
MATPAAKSGTPLLLMALGWLGSAPQLQKLGRACATSDKGMT